MSVLPQVLMTSSKPWDPSIYDTKCTIEELFCSLPAIPAGTCEDMYDKEGNIVCSDNVDYSSDVIITTVDDDGNTIVTICDDATVPIIYIAEFTIPFDFVDFPNYEISSDSDVSLDSASQSSVCSGQRCHRCCYIKPYWPLPPKIWKPQTNKDKSYCSYLSKFEYTDDDNSVPGLSDRFHTPCSFLLDYTNANLSPS